jgi:hypothetical protein
MKMKQFLHKLIFKVIAVGISGENEVNKQKLSAAAPRRILLQADSIKQPNFVSVEK